MPAGSREPGKPQHKEKKSPWGLEAASVPAGVPARVAPKRTSHPSVPESGCKEGLCDNYAPCTLRTTGKASTPQLFGNTKIVLRRFWPAGLPLSDAMPSESKPADMVFEFCV